MRRTKSRLEGKTVEILASGMDYSIHGQIKGIFKETICADDAQYFYELETKDGFIYLINVDDVCWMSTKKQKYKHLKVVTLSAKTK